MTARMLAEFDQEVARLWQEVYASLDLDRRSSQELRYLIHEHSVFSRENPAFLSRATESAAAVPDLARELHHNFLEESGQEDDQPDHFTLYSAGLRTSFGFGLDQHTPDAPTARFVERILSLAGEGDASVACGAFYATECAAVTELELVREIVQRYGKQNDTAVDRSVLDFFDLHLNGVEQQHRDGIGDFVREADRYGFDDAELERGFREAVGAMRTWWAELATAVR